MWNMFNAVDFGEYHDLLFSPESPIAPQLILFNGIIILILLYRWAAKSKPIPRTSRRMYKFLFALINIIILIQREIGVSEYLLMATPKYVLQYFM